MLQYRRVLSRRGAWERKSLTAALHSAKLENSLVLVRCYPEARLVIL